MVCSNSRCFSRIGRDPENIEQKISIGIGCERIGTVVHEIMHALGFFHEHTRPDRDKYIHIDWGNIEQGKILSKSNLPIIVIIMEGRFLIKYRFYGLKQCHCQYLSLSECLLYKCLI